MRNYLKGALAAAMLLGGGFAIAEDAPKQPATDPSGAKASGMESSKENTEVTGTVVRADKTLLSVRNAQGKSIPLKIVSDTRFDDPAVKAISDLKPGQEVRASYSVKGADNVATQVWLVESAPVEGTGSGGSGMEHDAGTYDHSTGGSGSQPIEQPAPGNVNEPVDMHE